MDSQLLELAHPFQGSLLGAGGRYVACGGQLTSERGFLPRRHSRPRVPCVGAGLVLGPHIPSFLFSGAAVVTHKPWGVLRSSFVVGAPVHGAPRPAWGRR